MNCYIIGKHFQRGGLELIDEWSPEQGVLWIESDGKDLAADRRLLGETLNAPEDLKAECLHPRKPPKFEGEGGFRFLLLRDLDETTRDLDFDTIQLRLLWSEHLVFSRRNGPSMAVDNTLSAMENGWRPDSAIDLVGHLAGAVFDRYLPLVLELEDRLEWLEVEMFARENDAMLRELVGYRTSLRVLLRITAYHRAAWREFMKTVAEPDVREALDPHSETLERVSTLQQMYYDLCGDLVEGYLSLSAHRLNGIMKVLTIITAIFVPLGLIAGLYGMNFEYMPELSWKYGYFTVLGGMATVVVGLLIAFRWRRWV